MSYVDRRSIDDGHIIIGGTGRAGTTLLVQYFTALGFDTGWDLERAVSSVDAVSKAGLEQSVNKSLKQNRKLAYVAKSPYYGKNLTDYLSSGELKIKHCIIPVRDLTAAAESRRRVSAAAVEAGASPDEVHKGGLIGGPNAGPRQERLLAVKFFELVYTMLQFDVPIHFLKFPEFARGEQDLYEALRPVLEEHGVTREEHEEALALVLRPDYINDFPAEPKADQVPQAEPAPAPPAGPAPLWKRAARRLLRR